MGVFNKFLISKDEYDELEQHSAKLTSENEALLNRIAELESELQDKVTVHEQSIADTLMSVQNEHLKSNLVDVQTNMSDSVNSSKNSLSKT